MSYEKNYQPVMPLGDRLLYTLRSTGYQTRVELRYTAGVDPKEAKHFNLHLRGLIQRGKIDVQPGIASGPAGFKLRQAHV